MQAALEFGSANKLRSSDWSRHARLKEAMTFLAQRIVHSMKPISDQRLYHLAAALV